MGAVFCEKGHFLQMLGARNGRVEKFCSQCGAPAVNKCPSCQSGLSGATTAPDFCDQCGKPFPWSKSR